MNEQQPSAPGLGPEDVSFLSHRLKRRKDRLIEVVDIDRISYCNREIQDALCGSGELQGATISTRPHCALIPCGARLALAPRRTSMLPTLVYRI